MHYRAKNVTLWWSGIDLIAQPEPSGLQEMAAEMNRSGCQRTVLYGYPFRTQREACWKSIRSDFPMSIVAKRGCVCQRTRYNAPIPLVVGFTTFIVRYLIGRTVPERWCGLYTLTTYQKDRARQSFYTTT